MYHVLEDAPYGKRIDFSFYFAYNINDRQECHRNQTGGVSMATSSIFTNVVISDPKKAEIFIDALDKSSRDPEWEPSTSAGPPLRDIEAIRRLMEKRVQK